MDPQNHTPLPESLYSKKRWAHFFYGILFSAVCAFVIALPGPDSQKIPVLATGDIAPFNIRSPISAKIESRDIPQAERDSLLQKVPPVFDYDDRILPKWIQNWERAFHTLQNLGTSSYKNVKANPTRLSQELENIDSLIQKQTGQRISREDLAWLYSRNFSQEIEKTFMLLAKPLLGRLLSVEDLFPLHYGTGIVVRQIQLGLNEALLQDVSRIWSLEHARQLISQVLVTLPGFQSEEKQRVAFIVRQLLIPNLVFNPSLTQKRIDTFISERRPPARRIDRGEILLQRGEQVNDAHQELLRNLRTLTSWQAHIWQFCLIFIILSVLFSVLFRLELGRKSFWKLTLKNACVLLLVSILTLIGVKFSIPQLSKVLLRFHLEFGAEYLVPVAAGGMILHLVLGKEIAYTYALVVSFACSLWLDQKFSFGLWIFVTTATAIQTIGTCKLRTDIYKSGFLSGQAGAFTVFGLSLMELFGRQHLDWTLVASLMGFAFLSGMLSAVLTSSLIPVLEYFLGYTTSLKLLELSNFNHPLLHNLMMKAPGTYHHSVIAGSLAEIAADRVKANPLLARVAAYYHDIGKMTKPLYFIENQAPNHNPHDTLTPTISAKILFAHVKIGVRMATEHNLGEEITGIIEQHHGTTLITYFFNRAKDHEDAKHDHVHESEFRYPGPKPQTREAAIVMLADSCEAATRSIVEPTPAKIQNMVRNIINNRFLEQQFSDCDLTLSDLKTIEECFVRTLVSIYHNRIEYPGQKQAVSS